MIMSWIHFGTEITKAAVNVDQEVKFHRGYVCKVHFGVSKQVRGPTQITEVQCRCFAKIPYNVNLETR